MKNLSLHDSGLAELLLRAIFQFGFGVDINHTQFIHALQNYDYVRCLKFRSREAKMTRKPIPECRQGIFQHDTTSPYLITSQGLKLFQSSKFFDRYAETKQYIHTYIHIYMSLQTMKQMAVVVENIEEVCIDHFKRHSLNQIHNASGSNLSIL